MNTNKYYIMTPNNSSTPVSIFSEIPEPVFDIASAMVKDDRQLDINAIVATGIELFYLVYAAQSGQMSSEALLQRLQAIVPSRQAA